MAEAAVTGPADRPLPPAEQTPGRAARSGDPIRSNSVLPADRRAVNLGTPDGLRLQADLALPADRPPVATLVCLHPLPTQGGSLDSHVYRKAAWRLPALAGVAVLRLNTRGTGGSEGRYDGGDRERYDIAAALDFVEAGPAGSGPGLPSPWLVGWSFGAELVLRYGHQDPAVVGGIVLSPPLHSAGDADLRAWAASGKPLLALVPGRDDYLRPAAAAARFAQVPRCQLVAVEGAGHLWVGEKYVRRVLDAIVAHVVPGAGPLPTTWHPP